MVVGTIMGPALVLLPCDASKRWVNQGRDMSSRRISAGPPVDVVVIRASPERKCNHAKFDDLLPRNTKAVLSLWAPLSFGKWKTTSGLT